MNQSRSAIGVRDGGALPRRRARGATNGPSGCRLRSASALLLLALLLQACGGTSPRLGWQGGSRQWFDAEVLTGMGDRGQPVATLTVSIPFRNLVFLQTEEGFVARYRIRATQRVAGKAIRLDEWSGEAAVATYAETRRSMVTRRTITIDLAGQEAGSRDVELDVRVELERTRRAASTLLSLKPTQFREGGVALGELALYRLRDPLQPAPQPLEVMGRAMPDPSRFRRQTSGDFDLATGTPWLLVRIYDLRADGPASELELILRVRADGSDDARWTRELSVPSQGTETAVLLELPAEAFAFGTNRLRVSTPGTESAEVDLQNLGLDLADAASWQANLRQIEVLAKSDELDHLREASPTERPQLWIEFWKRRDPDDSTPQNERLEEHYRRVAHARAFLKDGVRDGALSDRGRVYVLHGKPDVVEQSAPQMDSFSSYEVWRYTREGLVYYFQDLDGFGRYRLVWRERA